MRLHKTLLAFATGLALAEGAQAADICHTYTALVTFIGRSDYCESNPFPPCGIGTMLCGFGNPWSPPLLYPGTGSSISSTYHGCQLPITYDFTISSNTSGYIGPVGPVGSASCSLAPPDNTCVTTICSGSMSAVMVRGDEPPELQGPNCRVNNSGGPNPAAPSGNIPRPVNVLNGNMWFSHTDIQIPGKGTGLELTRTYNSKLVPWGGSAAGIFGWGWTHTYEQRIVVYPPTTLKVREASGAVSYFQDDDEDSLYEPSLPFVQDSTIVKSGTTYIRTFRSGSVEVYDVATGALLSLSDANGNTTQLTRDVNGRLTTITEPSGRFLTLAYDAAGKLVSLSGPDGLIAQYTYLNGSLISVRYPDGSGYDYTYGAGGITVVKDAAGRVLEIHSYDGSGRAITSELADGQEKYTLSYNGTQTTVTDALGNSTVYEWQTVFGNTPRITKITGPCVGCGGGGGNIQRWTYDDKGRILSYTNGLNQTTTYTYDAASNLLTVTNPLNQTTSYTYDSQGRVLTVTGPDNAVTTTTYSAAGPLTITDPLNRVTSFSYNGEGALTTITDPRGKITTFTYNVTGDLSSVTDPLTHAATFGYDALGRRTTVTDALNHTTTTAHDPRGRITRVTSHDGTHTDFTYDLSGNRTSVTDPLGHTTYSVFDPYSRLTQVVDAAAGVTAYGYDLMSNLISLTDAKQQGTNFTYDAYSRMSAVTYPSGAAETYTYDDAGRLATRTDRKGIVTTYSYDALGRLTGKSYSDGTTPAVSYTYDTAGRLATAANGADTLGWSYDVAGQLLSETSARNSSIVAYTYDAGGNRLTTSLDGILFVSYAYDEANRLSTITRATHSFSFAYDAAHRRTSMTYPNGVITTYTYDALNRVVHIRAEHDTTPVTDFRYTYDADGNRTRKQQLDYTEDYVYDGLSRLVGVQRSAGLAGSSRYGYDAVGNRLTEQVDGVVINSTFNDRNQLLSRIGGGTMRWRGALSEPGNVTVTGAVAIGVSARMLAGNVFEADVPVVAGVNTLATQATDLSANAITRYYRVDVTGIISSYTYDPNGNLTQRLEASDIWTYRWNAENQLTAVLRNEQPVATMAYDPLGRRVETSSGTVVTKDTYSYEDVLRQERANAVLRYVQGPAVDELLAVEDDAGRLTFEHLDALLSEIIRSDGVATPILSRRYDPFGRVETEATIQGPAFSGREWDAPTGLYYYRSRYLDPGSGRFLSQDPIEFDGGYNFYTYVLNNPVLLRDPWGLDAITDDPNVRSCICTLWKKAQYGTVYSEQAADIVRTKNGLACSFWPWLGPGAGNSQSSYQTRPREWSLIDVVAFIHTHSNNAMQRPTPPGTSQRQKMGDYDKPRPNYVICRAGIFMAGSGCGSKDVAPCTSQEAGPKWYDEFCKPPKKK